MFREDFAVFDDLPSSRDDRAGRRVSFSIDMVSLPEAIGFAGTNARLPLRMAVISLRLASL